MENIEADEMSSDDCDVFQCGKCKSEFSSLELFKSHKKTKCKRNKNNFHGITNKEEHLATLTYDAVTSTSKEVMDDSLKNQETEEILSPVVKKNFYSHNTVQVISVNGIIHLTAPMDENEIATSVSNLFSRTNNSEQPEGTTDEMASVKSDSHVLAEESIANIIPEIKGEEKQESLNYNHDLFHGSLAKPSSKADHSKAKVKQKCGYCGREFVKHFDLQQHIRSHTGEKPFQCIVCGRAFAQKSNVKKHMETHKVWPSESLSNTLPKDPIKQVIFNKEKEVMFDSSYVCYFCGVSLPSYIQLRSHMKLHYDRKVYRCVQTNCEQTFEDMEAFMDHVRKHGTDTQYRCHTCSKSFDSLQSLGLHHVEHSLYPNSRKKAGESYFRCTKCLNKYSSLEALEYHLKNTTHHFPCDHCTKVFSSERLLRRHLHVHGKINITTCSTCKKEFKNIYRLKLHLLMHTGERPFKCQLCDVAFYRKDGLKRHMLIHSNKKLKCPFRARLGCMTEFRRTDKLRSHMLSHVKAHKKLISAKSKPQKKSRRKNTIVISADHIDGNTLSKTDEYDATDGFDAGGVSFVPQGNMLGPDEEEVEKRSEVSLFEEQPLYEPHIQLIDDHKLSDFAYDTGGKKYVEIVRIPFDQSWADPRSLGDGESVIHDDQLEQASAAMFAESGAEPFVAAEISDLSLFVTPQGEECASIQLRTKDVSWNATS